MPRRYRSPDSGYLCSLIEGSLRESGEFGQGARVKGRLEQWGDGLYRSA